MIDKVYFEVKPAIYFRDLLVSMAAFLVSFVWCLNAGGWQFIVAFAVATISIHRAGFFLHEITHQTGNPRMRAFAVFWDLTVGACIMVPSARFIRPHLTHHAVGTFRTRDDPQYLMLRGNWKLSALLLIVMPPLMPVLGLLQMITSSIGGIAAEEAVEAFLLRRGMPTGATLRSRHKSQVAWLSRYYLLMWTVYGLLLPETLPLAYAILTAAWYLTTWRIPLEHRMESRLERSDRHDQFVDSFTIEWPLAWLLQPIGMKFHTAHHLYAGVPYHNLPALHAELKAADPEYRRSVLSIWDVLRGVPERARDADVAR